MIRALTAAIALAVVLAGCDGGGAQEAGPVPTGTASGPPATNSQEATTGTTASGSTSSEPPLCRGHSVKFTADSQQGAAGTIATIWRAKNTSSQACRSLGYPGMDFQTANGWLDVRVHRGGSLPNIDQPPARVVLQPGQSLYFVSYWSDVDTDAGPCQEFGQAKVTLPDNFRSVKLSTRGCLNPESVRVGPVSGTRPS